MTNTTRYRSRILIIDDDQSVWDSFKLILRPEQPDPDSSTAQLKQLLLDDTPEEAEEFELVCAGQGQDGYQLVANNRERPFAMAFIDIRMPPGWDGMETALQIRQIDPDIELVIVSAYSDRTIQDIVTAVGTPDKLLFLRKPFDADEVQQMARCLTGKWLLIQEEKKLRSAREKIEGQLRQAQKMEALGTLAGGIAHDFNNILSAIMGYTDLALLRNRDNEALQDDLRPVRLAAERAADLVRQILTFTRQEPKERLPLKIGLVIKEATKLIRATIPSTIRMEPIIDINTTALADPTHIHQLVMNLCTNASQAMAESGGLLDVNLREKELQTGEVTMDGVEMPAGRYAVLTVRDTGCGIDQTNLERIFDPYFTTKEKGKGTGLGLAMVHGIVRDHHGAITVSSERGEGTTFTVYLPTISGEPMSSETTVAPPKSKAGERIMIVDDETMLAELAGHLLTAAGYRVDTFANSTAAWQALSATPKAWDLLVTDLTMPGLTGTQLAIKAMTVRPELPIILCSGYSQMANEGRLAQNGIRAFLQKPIDGNALLTAVARVLAPTAIPQPTAAPSNSTPSAAQQGGLERAA